MGKKILLAEDSLTIQKVFEIAFARSDLSLTMVDNGDDAVRLAGETAPDLVVADVTLPGRDGFQVAQELRSSDKTRSCPVLILSGTLSPFDEEKFRTCGADAVLFKPFEFHQLTDKVQELLKGREEAAREKGGEPAPTAEEPWDFSDVLEEVAQVGEKAPLSTAAGREEELLPGATIAPAPTTGGLSLGEFDVSLEEIEEAPPGPAPPVEHIEGDFLMDAPGAVTDLSPALSAVEEQEEKEALEEMELIEKESEAHPPPVIPPVPPREAPSAPAAAHAVPPADAAESVLREQFSARAQDIFEKVAAETMEKVFWEYMDRFSAEFSAKLRETIEAVAWEVIPPTAEELIREEISRIREKTEKKSS